MSQRAIMTKALGASCGALALAAVSLLPGCQGEPEGDAAYSQKFEKPAGVTAPPPGQQNLTPGEIRALEKERDREAANKRKSKRSR